MVSSPWIVRITRPDDPRLAPFRKLRDRDPADKHGTFIAEGRWVVDRLLASKYAIESILVEQGKAGPFINAVPSGVPIYVLPRPMIEQLVGFDFHRGVIACARREPFTDVSELSFPPGAAKLALAVLDVDDQENMGSLMRSAAALGVDQILLAPNTIDPFRRRVIRVSMANVLAHRFFMMPDPLTVLTDLAERGFRTVAGTLQDAIELRDFRRDDRPIILLVGNEARGIDERIQQAATDRVRIPMQAGCDSLNVAVAAAIMMYQLRE